MPSLNNKNNNNNYYYYNNKKNNNKKIIIIGAGVAGMSAAMHLIKAGLTVEIYESSNKIGGRCFSFADKNFDDIILDNGQHVFAGAYKVFFELLNWLEAKNNLIYQKALIVKLKKYSGETYSIDCSKFPGKVGLIFAIINLAIFTPKEKINLFRAIIHISKISINNKREIFIDEPVINFLKRQKQSDNLITHFWEPMVLAMLNAPIIKASTKVFISVLKILLLSDVSNSKLVFTEATFSQLFSNFNRKLLENNSRFFLNSPVKKILINKNICTGIELFNKQKISADFVISTLPPAMLSKITYNNLYNYHSDFKYSTIISVYLLYSEVVTQEKFIGSIGTHIQWITSKIINNTQVNTQTKKQNERKQLLSLTISAADNLINNSNHILSNNELLEIILLELNKILPTTKKTKLIAKKIIRDKQATVLINSQNSSLRPNSITSINNFFIAGDWTNTGLPATIESAAFSGRLAAEAILDLY